MDFSFRLSDAFEKRVFTKKKRVVPVAIITGFLGSGKTTLVKHILSTKQNLRLSVAVNDFAEINLDARLIRESYTTEDGREVFELSNGSICSSRKGDLCEAVASVLNAEYDTDYLVVETSGITDPYELVSTLDQNFGRMTRARLDSVITLVDAAAIISAGGIADDEAGQVMRAQLQCADAVLVNKCDLVSDEERCKVEEAVAKVAPHARINYATFASVRLPWLLDVEAERLEAAPEGTVSHETRPAAEMRYVVGAEADRLRSQSAALSARTGVLVDDAFRATVIRSTKPLPFAGLAAFLAAPAVQSAMRMKGTLRLAEEADQRFSLHSCGTVRRNIERMGRFATEPATELVVIGPHLDADAVQAAFQQSFTTQPGDLAALAELAEQDGRFQVDTERGQSSLILRAVGTSAAESELHGVNLDNLNSTLSSAINFRTSATLALPVMLEKHLAVLIPLPAGIDAQHVWNDVRAESERVFRIHIKHAAGCRCGW